VEDVSVFVLAGGRSSRMGSDKALLPLGSRNLLQLTLEKARVLVPRPVIVGSRNRYAQYGAVIEDVIPGCGPLSGVHAALGATQTDVNLVLSVDMPLMTTDFLRWLLRVASESVELAIVPEAEGRLQPLCAVYRRAVHGVVEDALRMGLYKVDRLFALFPTRFIAESDWLAAGFSPNIFRNINTPEEYEAVAGALADVLQSSNIGRNS
jgi:molybdenum cofactor guanylyltransferase